MALLDDTDWVQSWRIYVNAAGTATGHYREGDSLISQSYPLPAGRRV